MIDEIAVVDIWRARHATALQQAMRLSNEAFAEFLGVAARTVAYWHAKPQRILKADVQGALDTALERVGPAVRARFSPALNRGGSSVVTEVGGAGATVRRNLSARVYANRALEKERFETQCKLLGDAGAVFDSGRKCWHIRWEDASVQALNAVLDVVSEYGAKLVLEEAEGG